MAQSLAHADLMDNTYRYQRLIYDATRRYYLLGRDRLISDLKPAHEARVLEIACGTGRNLAKISRRYPNCRLYGLDISKEMLRSAEAKLGRRAWLQHGDACTFDGRTLFSCGGFDRIVISYGLSMIPDWTRALQNAASQLRPGGELHIVDFGDQTGLPEWFERLLLGWLDRFHVTPRVELRAVMGLVADGLDLQCRHETLFRGYAQRGILARP